MDTFIKQLFQPLRENDSHISESALARKLGLLQYSLNPLCFHWQCEALCFPQGPWSHGLYSGNQKRGKNCGFHPAR